MILVDANLLVYAHVGTMPQHPEAKVWLDGRLNAHEPVGLPWPSLLSFLRLVTNPRIFSSPESMGGAWQQVEDWIACPSVWIPGPTERHAEILGSLIAQASGRSNLVPDVHLAALGIEHGLTLCTTDGDFARFSGIRWMNPIV